MSIRPAEGERRAAIGYRSQYFVSAVLILEALNKGDLEWIRVADTEAGRVDDVQIGTTARVDAYQTKWHQYPEAFTLRKLTEPAGSSLILQLADGWRRLRENFPNRRVVVHLSTNEYPSSSRGGGDAREEHTSNASSLGCVYRASMETGTSEWLGYLERRVGSCVGDNS